MKKIKILVAAGGTGGHLFPALAVVEQLELLAGERLAISFIGSPDRIESKVVPRLGYDYHKITVTGFAGLSFKSLKLPFSILKSLLYCRKLIDKENFDAVICAGAYLSYPPGLAASQKNLPLFVMESNVNPGKTNKLLAPKATLIFTAFAESKNYFPAALHDKLRAFGNPVRRSILELPAREEAIASFGLDADRKTVLIVGGSLGARSINEAVEANIGILSKSDYQIIWQTGKSYRLHGGLPVNIKQLQFIDDMNSAYAAADLVVSRSGATTIAELCAVGKPSVLVPLPSAATNEQAHNAKVPAGSGAAIIVNDSEISGKLIATIGSLIGDGQRLSEMSSAAKALGRPDAAWKCAEEILEEVS